MTFPIQLSTDTRKSWASDPRDLSNLLINVITIISEVVTDKADKVYLDAIKIGVNSYFNKENFQVTATIGAFYRASNPNIVTITDEDLECIKSQLVRMDIKEAPESYLKRFTALARSPKDSHIALLKEFLFPHLGLQTKDKYKAPITELINATLNVVDFMNTPVAVLYAEEEFNEITANLEKKWDNAIAGLIGALTQLLPLKTKPSEIMKSKVSEIISDLDRFQSTFRSQKMLHETQQENLKLKTDWHAKYLELAQYIHAHMNTESKEFDINGDFIQPLIDYGTNWHAQYIALESKQAEEKETLEVEQMSDKLKLHTLDASVKNLTLEAEKIKQENEALKVNSARQLKEIDTLKERLQKQLEELTAIQQVNQSFVTSGINQRKEIVDLKVTVQKQLKELITIKQDVLSKASNDTHKHDSAPQRDNDLAQDTTATQDNPKNGTEQSAPPIAPPFPIIDLTDLIKQFEAKFKNTNSSGIKEIISYMKVLETEQITEFDKLALLSDTMRRITLERKDSSWSKSHFFGKGRHQGVQELYDLMANKSFSLNVPDKADKFLAMIEDTNKVFTHSLS